MLIALLIIAVLGCIVRGHHMFMVGFDLDTRSYFTFPTSIIAIPTGIKILNRLATIWTSCFSLITPLYFIIGFPFSSSFGGFTGLIDTILHDSYFIIGHLHYVLSLGAIYTISAAFWIKLKVITIKNLSFIIIITGYLLFILSMIEGFKTIWWSFIGFYVHS